MRTQGLEVVPCSSYTEFRERFRDPFYEGRAAAGLGVSTWEGDDAMWLLGGERYYRFFYCADPAGRVLATLGTYSFGGVATEIMSGRTPYGLAAGLPAQDFLHWRGPCSCTKRPVTRTSTWRVSTPSLDSQGRRHTTVQGEMGRSYGACKRVLAVRSAGCPPNGEKVTLAIVPQASRLIHGAEQLGACWSCSGIGGRLRRWSPYDEKVLADANREYHNLARRVQTRVVVLPIGPVQRHVPTPAPDQPACPLRRCQRRLGHVGVEMDQLPTKTKGTLEDAGDLGWRKVKEYFSCEDQVYWFELRATKVTLHEFHRDMTTLCGPSSRFDLARRYVDPRVALEVGQHVEEDPGQSAEPAPDLKDRTGS